MKEQLEKIKQVLKKFFLINDTPHKIAAGFALGVFWGIMPGEGVVITLVTAMILRVNRLSAVSGVAMSNMWGTVVVLPLAAFFGCLFFGGESAALISSFQATYSLGWEHFLTEIIFWEILLPLFVGFLFVSLVISAFCYGGIFYLLKYKKIRFK